MDILWLIEQKTLQKYPHISLTMVEYNIPKHTIQSSNNRYPDMLSTHLLILNQLPNNF